MQVPMHSNSGHSIALSWTSLYSKLLIRLISAHAERFCVSRVTVLHLQRQATILLWEQLGLYWRDLEKKVMVLTRNLHMFQDIFELKVENKN